MIFRPDCASYTHRLLRKLTSPEEPSMAKYDYDMITIGAGSGGVRASRLAGGYGARSAVVEADRVGGTCVLRGCVPKKLLIYGAHYADHMADARNYGWTIDASHDWGALVDNKNAEMDRLNGIYMRILENNKVDFFNEFEVFISDNKDTKLLLQ